MSAAGARLLVLHAGALGDFVLTWPMIRAAARAGMAVTVAASPSHARLAEVELGVAGLSTESAWCRSLWRDDDPDRWPAPPACDVVMTFIAAGDEAGERAWRERVGQRTGAEVVAVGPPGSSSRRAVWERFEVERLGAVAARGEDEGPVVLHIGAGGRAKAWPVERWVAVAERLREGGAGAGVRIIAGEVERERLSVDDRGTFERAGGCFVGDLLALRDVIAGAGCFVACDTGPAHLAAQMGVRTVALFGPTDPSVWAPVGPRVRVVAPAGGALTPDMRWLNVDEVVSAIREATDQGPRMA